jgi:RNA ligase
MECRALTLNSKTFDLVARAFPRFFNIGEALHLMEDFDWSSCWTSEKCDGSLLTLYYYNGWRVNTRGTFGEGELNFSGRSWSNVFFDTIDKSKVEDLKRGNSYVFEFWSPYNKVVTDYGQPCSFLLTIYDGETELEQDYADEVAKQLNCRRPGRYDFHGLEEVQRYVEANGYANPTWEGVVLCDSAKRRWKLKNSLYVSLHHLKDNGNIFNPRKMLPLVLNGEIDEVLCHVPEALQAAKDMKMEVDQALLEVLELWDEVKDIPTAKEFAETIIPKTKFSGLLFKARQKNISPKHLWAESEDLILKVLYNK